MHLYFNGFSDEAIHVERISVSWSLMLWSWLKLCSATADFSGCSNLICLSCSLMRSWTDRPLCPMYTLPHSQGILYMPGVLNPVGSFVGEMLPSRIKDIHTTGGGVGTKPIWTPWEKDHPPANDILFPGRSVLNLIVTVNKVRRPSTVTSTSAFLIFSFKQNHAASMADEFIHTETAASSCLASSTPSGKSRSAPDCGTRTWRHSGDRSHV